MELTNTRYSFRFSQEELTYLVELQGAKTLPTLGAAPYGSLAPEQIALLRASAQRGLIARDFLVFAADGQLTIDSYLDKIIKLCVSPRYTIVLINRPGLEPTTQIDTYYWLSEMAIFHTMPFPAIHDLTLLNTLPDLTQVTLRYLAEAQLANPAKEAAFEISRATLAAVQDLARQGTLAPAQDQLVAAGTPPELAELFASALSQPKQRLVIQVIPSINPATARTLTILLAESGCWLLQGVEAVVDAAPVKITLVAKEQLATELGHFFAVITETP